MLLKFNKQINKLSFIRTPICYIYIYLFISRVSTQRHHDNFTIVIKTRIRYKKILSHFIQGNNIFQNWNTQLHIGWWLRYFFTNWTWKISTCLPDNIPITWVINYAKFNQFQFVFFEHIFCIRLGNDKSNYLKNVLFLV